MASSHSQQDGNPSTSDLFIGQLDAMMNTVQGHSRSLKESELQWKQLVLKLSEIGTTIKLVISRMEEIEAYLQQLRGPESECEESSHHNEEETVRSYIEGVSCFVMPKLKTILKKGEEWVSPSFYTYNHGYKMCLIARGHLMGSGEVALLLNLCATSGEYDNKLNWPAKFCVMLEIINKQGGANLMFRGGKNKWNCPQENLIPLGFGRDSQNPQEYIIVDVRDLADCIENNSLELKISMCPLRTKRTSIQMAPIHDDLTKTIKPKYQNDEVGASAKYKKQEVASRTKRTSIQMAPAPDDPTKTIKPKHQEDEVGASAKHKNKEVAKRTSIQMAPAPDDLTKTIKPKYQEDEVGASAAKYKKQEVVLGQCTGTEGKVLGSFLMPCTTEIFDERMDWKSPSVYTHHEGYKVCLGVMAYKEGIMSRKVIALTVYGVPGEFDQELKWPVEFNFKVQIVSQYSGGKNLIFVTGRNFWKCPSNYVPLRFYGQPSNSVVIKYNSVKKLVKDDMLEFRISIL